MAKNNVYLYIVEGECEEHALNFLKGNYIQSGKVLRRNPIQSELTNMHIRNIKDNTVAILIFDTDTSDGTKILIKNKKTLESCKKVKDVVLIPQVKNFEEELIKSTDIRRIEEFTNSRSQSDFKRDFLNNRNLENLFKKNNFNINRFWKGTPTGLYQGIENNSDKIILKKR